MKQLSRVEPTWRLPEVAQVAAAPRASTTEWRRPRPAWPPCEPAGSRSVDSKPPGSCCVAGLFGLYEVGRNVAAGHVSRAFANAGSLWHLERWLHLPDEATLQAPFVSHPDLAHAANVFYASVHFPLTIATLVLLWWFRPDDYRWTRTVMAAMTFAALLLQTAMPLAPPRMLSGVGLVDLAHLYGPSVYGTAANSGFTDQFAAMPSLHVGWAVLVAVAAIRALRSRWRFLVVLHPALTLTVVLVTGNHYWLDGAVSIVLLCLAIQLEPRSQRGVHPGPIGAQTEWPRYGKWVIPALVFSGLQAHPVRVHIVGTPTSATRIRRAKTPRSVADWLVSVRSICLVGFRWSPGSGNCSTRNSATRTTASVTSRSHYPTVRDRGH